MALSLVSGLVLAGATTGMLWAPTTFLLSLTASRTLSPPSSHTILTAPFRSSWRPGDMGVPFTLSLSMPAQTHLSLTALICQLQNNSSWQMEFIQMRSIGLLDKKTTLPFRARSSTSVPITPIPFASPNVLDNSESSCKLKERPCTGAPPAYLQQTLTLVYTGVLSTTSQPPLPPFPNAKFGL